jgi:DNA-binding CsgD family transcriptional regulator
MEHPACGHARPRRTDPARPVSGWEALTPTEVKVACLVAEGRSNPDVAAELFLSRYTVQTHVSHILAKLGIRVGAAGEEQRRHVDVEGIAVLHVVGVFAADSVPEQGQSVLGLVFDVVACVQDLPELEQVALFDRLMAWRQGGLGCWQHTDPRDPSGKAPAPQYATTRARPGRSLAEPLQGLGISGQLLI